MIGRNARYHLEMDVVYGKRIVDDGLSPYLYFTTKYLVVDQYQFLCSCFTAIFIFLGLQSAELSTDRCTIFTRHSHQLVSALIQLNFST